MQHFVKELQEAVRILALNNKTIQAVSGRSGATLAGVVIMIITGIAIAVGFALLTGFGPLSLSVVGGLIVGIFVYAALIHVFAMVAGRRGDYWAVFRPLAFASLIFVALIATVIPGIGDAGRIISGIASIWYLVTAFVIIGIVYRFQAVKAFIVFIAATAVISVLPVPFYAGLGIF